MKRVVSFMLLAVMLLGCIGLVGCGSEDGAMTEETAENPSSSSNPSETATANPLSGDTRNWGIPVYPRYDSESEFFVKSDKDQFLNDKPAVFESRFITTSDTVDTVVGFYKEKMSASGWKEVVWGGSGGVGGMYVGEYVKNDGRESAAIAIGNDGDGTSIQLGWTYVK